MKKIFLVTLVFLLMNVGCNNGPKELAYGSDGCHYCSMTIVDKQHAALFMTKKGRTYSFDATECMLNHLKGIDESTVSLFLVNNYDSPVETIDATTASYLISKNIPSPMGAFLSAFSSEEASKIAQEKNGGKIFTWEELKVKINKKNAG